MTENMKKFMEAVSKNEALVDKVNTMTRQELIALAQEMGLELTDADFEKPSVEELSDDDLDAVSGGTKVACACVLGGGGKGDSNDKTCACVAAGFGYQKNGRERCFCAVGGAGYDY